MKARKIAAALLWAAAVAVSICVAYAFVNRDLASCLFLKTRFVSFDFEEFRLRFLTDCAAVMCLLARVCAVIFKRLKRPKRGISKDE